MRAAALFLLPLLATAFACDDESGLAGRLAEARRTWVANGPPDYEMVLFRGCFCGHEGTGPVRITVVGDEVTDRTYVETGEPVPERLAVHFPDVEGLFEVAAEAARRADRVEAEFDPELGHPVRLTIDWQANVADEEVDYRVRRLGPVPVNGG